MKTQNRLLFICDDVNTPTGGIKQIYRQVDVLNANGFNAYVLHRHYGFKCTWFANETQIAYSYPVFDLIDNLQEKSIQKGILGLLLRIKSIYKKSKETLLKIKNKIKIIPSKNWYNIIIIISIGFNKNNIFFFWYFIDITC